MISEESVRRMLFGETKLPGGQKQAAKRIGVSPAHLNDVLRGRRDLSAKLLRGLGYRRVVMYERIDPPPSGTGSPTRDNARPASPERET